MNIKDFKTRIGLIGEKLVARYLGPDAILTCTYDQFHPHDILFNKKTIQVKTFQLNKKTQGFWIGENQTHTLWDKIDCTDELYFVQVPDLVTDDINIYKCNDHKNAWERAYSNDGVAVRSYQLTKCELVYTVKCKELSAKLHEMSCKTSKFRTK